MLIALLDKFKGEKLNEKMATGYEEQILLISDKLNFLKCSNIYQREIPIE